MLPTIGCLRSTYTFYRLKGKELGVAMYMNHRESMKGKVGVPRNFLYLHDIYTL